MSPPARVFEQLSATSYQYDPELGSQGPLGPIEHHLNGVYYAFSTFLAGVTPHEPAHTYDLVVHLTRHGTLNWVFYDYNSANERYPLFTFYGNNLQFGPQDLAPYIMQ